jgi:hypothetical protein
MHKKIIYYLFQKFDKASKFVQIPFAIDNEVEPLYAPFWYSLESDSRLSVSMPIPNPDDF